MLQTSEGQMPHDAQKPKSRLQNLSSGASQADINTQQVHLFLPLNSMYSTQLLFLSTLVALESFHVV